MPKHVARVSLDDIHIWNLCLERGNALGEYASQALKVSDAAQPKGCSAHFVPMMAINKPDFLADIENNRHFTLALYRFFSKAGRVKAVNFFQDRTFFRTGQVREMHPPIIQALTRCACRQ